jgi:hypothetical protein
MHRERCNHLQIKSLKICENPNLQAGKPQETRFMSAQRKPWWSMPTWFLNSECGWSYKSAIYKNKFWFANEMMKLLSNHFRHYLIGLRLSWFAGLFKYLPTPDFTNTILNNFGATTINVSKYALFHAHLYSESWIVFHKAKWWNPSWMPRLSTYFGRWCLEHGSFQLLQLKKI